MKITSLNLAGYTDWKKREEKIASYLNETHPDIVFLQEVKYDAAVASENQAAVLNKKLMDSYPYSNVSISRYHTPPTGEPYREGLAILSKYPIISSEIFVLTKQPDDEHTRIIQQANIDIDGSTVPFINVHFSNNYHAIEQLEETMRFLQNARTKSIVVGDFNIYDIREARTLYDNTHTSSREYKEYISFPSEHATFDYILLPSPYRFQNLETTPNLSDHAAVAVEIKIA